MEEITTSTPLADIVEAVPGSRRTLEGLGLDYCCGGRRSLASACDDLGLDPADVLEQVRRSEPEPAAAWTGMGPDALVDHIEAVHHAYLHAELPRLSALVTKVIGAHGSRHPELVEVGRAFAELRDDLEPHLAKEERILFPAIRLLAQTGEAPATLPGGSVQAPISVMMRDHDRAAELLIALRDVTGGYQTPPDGCASYQALYEGLAELEADTHLHVHKENNLLFPAVVALERRLTTAPA
jgi:regulator of cell morphogenesis and NO signaling